MAAVEPFATVEQYEARFGSVADRGMLAECLADASAAIRVTLDKAHVDYSDPSEDLADRLMIVCRSMANRVMPSGTDVPAGVTQETVTAVGFSHSMSYTPSYGTPTPMPSELALLGIGGGRAGWAPLAGDGSDAS